MIFCDAGLPFVLLINILLLISCHKDKHNRCASSHPLRHTHHNLSASCSIPNTDSCQNTQLRIKELLQENPTELTDALIENVTKDPRSERDGHFERQLKKLQQGTIGVNYIDKDRYDFTLLHEVMVQLCTPIPNAEYDRLVLTLINMGADPNLRDAHGRLPIEMAISHQNASMVGILVASGAITKTRTSCDKNKKISG